MKRKVFIFGPTGMLGRYVYSWLQKNDDFEVIWGSRKLFDVSGMDTDELAQKLKPWLEDSEGDPVIINCAGIIKPVADEVGIYETIKVNSLFPHRLNEAAQILNAKLIHISTDCVFSGNRGPYEETDPHDPHDEYGKTKSLGEPVTATVIGTSIIGEELHRSRSLIEWAKSERGNKVKGFTNHTWNGMTCLQLSKIIEEIIEKDLFWEGRRHLYSNTLEKGKLLQYISKAFGLDLQIAEENAPQAIHRTLSTSFVEELQAFKIPQLKDQVFELFKFGKELEEHS